MANNRLVTVYIATYNRSQLLKKAITSILNQTYNPIEIIVSDDNSTDHTREMVEGLIVKYPQISYIQSDKHLGANYARNQAIVAAKGYYVTGLDDDDEMLPERIVKLVSAYEEDKAFVSSRYYIDDGRQLKVKRLTFKKYIDTNDLLYVNIVGNQVLTTKEKFVNAGLFDEGLLAGQDIDMWIRLLLQQPKGKILHEPLQVVKVGHPGITLSENKRKGYWQMYTKYKFIMTFNQRKYRLLGLYLSRPNTFSAVRLMKLLPLHPKYLLFSFIKIIKGYIINKSVKNTV